LIPFLDLRGSYGELKDEIDAAVDRALSSGRYIGGPEVEAFEAEFAAYCGARHGVGVGCGLDALYLALLAMEVGPGDEVIVASNTHISNWLAVSRTGARPVPVEPDPATHNMDPSRLEAAITERTRVILPTHLYGQPADLGPLLDLARRRGLRVLEDAAQAQGAAYRGQRIGSHGDAVAWSFYPSKNLGAFGDAGAVTTNDQEIAARVGALRNYGSKVRDVHMMRGVNSRLDPVQAAVLRVKLRVLDAWNTRRARVAERYSRALDGVAGIDLPQVPDWASPAWHLFVVTAQDRDGLADGLRAAGVETLVHYPTPPHLQPAYADLGISQGSLPIAERLARQVLSLPVGPHLSDDQVDIIVKAIRTTASPQA
jgi:dTDP-4-amino-4,6-dideoxygalactose transaminase